MIRFADLLIAAAALAAPVAASAQIPEPADGHLQRVVRYDDLDLSRPGDAKLLLVRLRSAAFEVCGPAANDPGTDALRRYGDEGRCVTKTVADSVRSVGSPELMRLAGLSGSDAVRLASR